MEKEIKANNKGIKNNKTNQTKAQQCFLSLCLEKVKENERMFVFFFAFGTCAELTFLGMQEEWEWERKR